MANLAKAQSADVDLLLKKYAITLTGKSVMEAKEKAAIDSILNTVEDEKSARSEMIDVLQRSNQYKVHMFYELNQEYLEGITLEQFTTELKDAFFLFSTRNKSIYHGYFKKNYFVYLNIYNYLLGKEQVNIQGLQKLLIDNQLYDQINMGNNNFVISTFQHFIGRKPTKYELAQSLDMLESQYGVLFNQSGSSKEDYLKILFSNTEYWQAQVVFWYRKVFYKNPTEDEILSYIQYMREEGSPEKLIKALLMNME